MKSISSVFVVCLILSLSSCGMLGGVGGGGVATTTSEVYAPTTPSEVKIFSSTVPEKKFIEIGTVSALRVKSPVFPKARPAEKVQQEMKEKAASIGGHAIINYRESGEANMTGTVIRYTE